MCIVHPFPLKGPAAFACAQAGCRVCLDDLMRQHEGLVHHVLRRQVSGAATYDEVLQEGRIALWQAILHFDPQRGVAFSTYAGVAIQHRIWHAAKQSGLPTGEPPQEASPDARELAEENVWCADVRTVLIEAISRLPERLRQAVCAAYGLDGAPPCTLDAIGQRFGVTGLPAAGRRDGALLAQQRPGLAAAARLFGAPAPVV